MKLAMVLKLDYLINGQIKDFLQSDLKTVFNILILKHTKDTNIQTVIIITIS